MRAVKISIGFLFFVMAFALVSVSAQQGRNRAVLYEGARLLTGDGGAPIENSAFLVENNKFTKVGKKGDVQAPAGAAHVDLTGKTVIPALIDIHNHLGWTDHKTNKATKESYTRALVIDHLQRYAFYGVAATLSMGLDRWDVNPDLPYQLRNEIIPNAARFLNVGRGIAATPMAGPVADYRLGVPYGAETEAEGIAHVRELHAKKVEMIKIWVDDRLGTVPKLKVPVYEAIINEAHKNGMRVVAHIFDLSDGKQLMKSGIDGFAHGVRNTDVDDEYMTILKAHPKVWEGPNLPGRTLTPAEMEEEITWLAEALPPSQVKRMRDQLANRVAGRGGRGGRGGGGAGPSDMFGIQCRNLKRVHDAGMILGVGTDANGDVGSGVHTELADMVFCGLTPAEAIVAGTKTGAEILKLKDLGTVANGKSADFVVLDANPLDNILNTRKINKVFLRGTEVDRAGLSRGFTTEARNSDDHQ
jgi:imidazolonepropionase-like amidohydrolase